MEAEIKPVKKRLPEKINLKQISTSDVLEEVKAYEIKDSSLSQYLEKEIVTVYSTEEAHATHNIDLPEYIIEKKAKRPENELKFGILADELDAGVEILYLRRNDSNELVYGSPFLKQSGMFRDMPFGNFKRYLEYVESVGEALGPLYQTRVIHDDLIGMRGGGDFRGLPYVRNIMVSGDNFQSILIDLEDARLEGEPRKKGESKHLREMNPQNAGEEYEAVLKALICEGIAHLDIFEKEYQGVNGKGRLAKEQILSYDKQRGVDFVDLDNLQKNTNPDFRGLIRHVGDKFEEGVTSGFKTVGEINDIKRSEIPHEQDILNGEWGLVGSINNLLFKTKDEELSQDVARIRLKEIDEWLYNNILEKTD